MLCEDILYEGSLFYKIPHLIIDDTMKFDLNLIIPINEEIYSTCLLIDDENKMIYLSPVTTTCFMEE